MSFSYVLIGEESLTVRCAELLQSRGHTARAVVASGALVPEWAEHNGAPTFTPSDLPAVARLEPFDYLLSIVNLKMVPPQLLATPTVAAINFHDGPLPLHAGLNAPVWALVEGNATFGVSWHLMTAEADTGDILESEHFVIEAEETALSLNMKCFEAAFRSFERLVGRLESKDVRGIPQDLSHRTYHAAADRPSNGGILDFARPAAELVRLVRALDFGFYPNPVGFAKLVNTCRAVIVTQAELAPDRPGEPGEVLGIDAGTIAIAAGDGTVQLGGFRTVEGDALSGPAAAAELGIRPGMRIEPLDAADWAALADASRESAGREVKCAAALQQASPLELPLVRQTSEKIGRALLPVASVAASKASIISGLGNLSARLSGTNSVLWVRHSPVSPVPAIDHLYGTGRPVLFRADAPRSPEDPAVADAAIPRLLARDIEARGSADRLQGDRVAVAFATAGPVDTSSFDAALLVGPTGEWCWEYDVSRFEANDLRSFAEVLVAVVAAGGDPYALPYSHRVIVDALNATKTAFDTCLTISEAFEQQAAENPERVAVIGGEVSLTYADLNARANRLASRLRELGVTPDSLIAVHIERSADTVTTLLGILKAGAAYVPVDPTYPAGRKRLMIEDSAAPIVVTTRDIASAVDIPGVAQVILEEVLDGAPLARNLPQEATPQSLAYVIYTSGSTGRPKGVMLTHRNALNFFAGMDERIGTQPGTWLAVTSISFDISILELLWTVTRGFTVVINGAKATPATTAPAFSLFFFASEGEEGRAAYDLVLNASRFADDHGFEAVWTPERHFHAFGGAFPNPSVISAAIAATTKRVKIRSGSCVLPLHSPIRVAEEWSVVDNLSNGRVGISFAAGWQPDDFVFRPENFGHAKEAMLRDIPTVQALWRGETRTFPGPGRDISVQILPRPVQPELPTWITSAGDPETFRQAGEMGTNVLTHLLGQSIESVEERVRVYRDAWAKAGHPGRGSVTIMLHTFIGDDEDAVRKAVREPMIRYLRSSVGLIKQFASSFPTFKSLPEGEDANDLLSSLTPQEMRELLEVAFERYYETSGLFGTPERASAMIQRLHSIGVDEIACLVDFGLPDSEVYAGLERLTALMRSVQASGDEQESIPDLIRRHGVSHLQCTPSMAAMMLADRDTREAFGGLDTVMVGGEALPADLARELVALTKGRVLNMYGPTETTIWSTTSPVHGDGLSCPIGTPIANTSVYILDREQRPLPVGFAGELWIGGDGVARGYLGRPELTAERFLPDPFASSPGARMYRTGDLARLRHDGVLAYLGRLDQQVKVRGYRIEPGEIEAALRAIDGINEAAVIAREDEPGDQRLVAYYVSRSGTPEESEIRTELSERLPEYMVPTNFVQMDALPWTPNAKLDRKALPAPDRVPIQAASSVALGLRTGDKATEEFVSSTWCHVLRSPAVPLDRSFFDLGGNSLLLLQVHKRLKEQHPELRLTDLFKYPTVGALAAHLGDNVASTEVGNDAMSRASARRAALSRRPVTA